MPQPYEPAAPEGLSPPFGQTPRMGITVWTSEPFLAEVTGWVQLEAGDAGLRLTGEWEQPHVAPWSSTVRFGTQDGGIWFKVNGPGTVAEPALLEALARRVPTLVPELVAVDRERGWSLMRDAGPTLRSVAPPDDLWNPWAEVLQSYAVAQLELAEHLGELRSTGIHDESPHLVPQIAAGIIERLSRRAPEAGGLAEDERARLGSVLPELESWCVELAASGIPTTINHDDLHSSNVCVGPAGARIIDWGDTGLSHPFTTMLATLNSIAWHAGLARDDARVLRMRDAYLEPFSGFADRADLYRWVTLARRVGCVGKAVSWAQALVGAPPGAEAEEDWPVRGWLLELLDPGP